MNLRTKLDVGWSLFASAVLLFNGPAFSQENSLKSLQSDFIDRYIAAVNSSDLNQLKAVMHPDYLDCIDDTNKHYYRNLFDKSLSRHIPDNRKIVFEPLSNEEARRETKGATERGIPYPVSPTHRFQIDYHNSEYSSVGIVRSLVLAENRYHIVSGCPSPKMIVRYNEMNARKLIEQQRAQELFGQLQGELLEKLTQLLKQGQKVQAWKLYSSETGESLSTARDVLSYIPIDSHSDTGPDDRTGG